MKERRIKGRPQSLGATEGSKDPRHEAAADFAKKERRGRKIVNFSDITETQEMRNRKGKRRANLYSGDTPCEGHETLASRKKRPPCGYRGGEEKRQSSQDTTRTTRRPRRQMGTAPYRHRPVLVLD